MVEFRPTPNGEPYNPHEGRETSPQTPWNRLLNELEAALTESEKQLAFDDLTLASYLAGLCTPEEKAQIEQVSQHNLELQMILEAARAGLAPEEPSPAEDAPTSRPAASSVLPETVSPNQANQTLAPSSPTPAASSVLPESPPATGPSVPAPSAESRQAALQPISPPEAETQQGTEPTGAPRPVSRGEPAPSAISPAVSAALQKSGGQPFARWSWFRWAAAAAALVAMGFLGWLLAWASTRGAIQDLQQQVARLQSEIHQESPKQAHLVHQLAKTQQQAAEVRQTPKENLPKRESGPTSVRGQQMGIPVVSIRDHPPLNEESDRGRGGFKVCRPVVETSVVQWNLPLDPNDTLPSPSKEVLVKGLSNPNDLVCWASVVALHPYRTDPEIWPKLVEALERLDSPPGRAAVKYSLGIAPSGAPPPEKAVELLAQPNQPDIVRWAALDYLFRAFLSSPSRGMVHAESMPAPVLPTGSTQPPSAPDWQKKLLEQIPRILQEDTRQGELSGVVRKMAIYLCGHLNAIGTDPSAQAAFAPIIAQLRKVLKEDPDPQNRRWAAFALAKISSPTEALGLVSDFAEMIHQWASQGPDPVVFPAVCYGLVEVSKKFHVSPYSSAPRGLPEDLKGQLEKLQPIFRQYVKSPEPNVHFWAAWALQEIEELLSRAEPPSPSPPTPELPSTSLPLQPPALPSPAQGPRGP